jgi:hypothetical protein
MSDILLSPGVQRFTPSGRSIDGRSGAGDQELELVLKVAAPGGVAVLAKSVNQRMLERLLALGSHTYETRDVERALEPGDTPMPAAERTNGEVVR